MTLPQQPAGQPWQELLDESPLGLAVLGAWPGGVWFFEPQCLVALPVGAQQQEFTAAPA